MKINSGSIYRLLTYLRQFSHYTAVEVVVDNEKAQLNESLSTLFMARSVKHACAHHWLRDRRPALVVGIQHSAAAFMLLKPPEPTKLMVPFTLHWVSLWKLQVSVCGMIVWFIQALP